MATAGAQGRQVERRTIATPPTPLNAAITAHRRFAYGSLPLDEIKTVKNAFAMTVNDVVMALCTAALRRWLLDHDGLPAAPIVVAVPVSIRADDQTGSNGNQVSVMLAEMPTHLADPADRLDRRAGRHGRGQGALRRGACVDPAGPLRRDPDGAVRPRRARRSSAW